MEASALVRDALFDQEAWMNAAARAFLDARSGNMHINIKGDYSLGAPGWARGCQEAPRRSASAERRQKAQARVQP